MCAAIIFKNSVLLHITRFVFVTNTERLVRFGKMMALYCENCIKPTGYTVWCKCRLVECLVCIVTTVLYTVKDPYWRLTKSSQSATSLCPPPLCHVTRVPTVITLRPNICSPLHKQFHHRQMSQPCRILQRTVLPHVQTIHLRFPVQQQTAHIQMSIVGC